MGTVDRVAGDRAHVVPELGCRPSFLAALLDNLEDAVIACDAEGRLVYLNEPMRQIVRAAELPETSHGWSRDWGLFAPDGRRRLEAEEVPLARALAGEQITGQEVVIRPPDGAARRYAINAQPIIDTDGRRLGAVAVGHEITAAHRTAVLRAVQHAVTDVVAQDGGAAATARGVLGAVAGVLGWCCGEYWRTDPATATITRTACWIRPNSDLSRFTGSQPLTFSRGQGLPGRVWATGRQIWTRDLTADDRGLVRARQARQAGLHAAIGLPVHRGGAGPVEGVLAFFNDQILSVDEDLVDLLEGVCARVGQYMDRHRADELAHELAVSRDRFDQVIAQLDDFIWVSELTAAGRLRSMYRSPNSAGIMGEQIDPDDDFTRYVHPDDRPVFQEFTAALGTGEPAQAEYRVIGVDGVTRWIWSRATPRRDGARLLVDGISTDITERHVLADEREHTLAQQREQVRRLRQLDAMKDELMAMVSHELRNPIGVIRGYTEMLSEASDLPAEYSTFVEVINRKSEHLQRLVDDLLDLARLEAGIVSVDARTVGLTRLIDQAVDDHRAAAADNDLTLTTELPSRLHVHADPVRLRQVLDNLLSNAVKYTPAGGAVTLTAAPACTRSTGNSDVIVTIADTGIGIPPDQYDQLFQRFFRSTTATEAGIKGTGLGLAITKAIITAHGGAITAAPRPGGGTVFTIYLPTEAPTREHPRQR
ncbi:ATP-binding protein [Spirillospora albida]|uniref:ATP-binding protein n=1 Tax=Spirillospora albida TaxID=58123 RepID=UPI00147031A0|nr:ATP-binding protein [Spirillospora albida]